MSNDHTVRQVSVTTSVYALGELDLPEELRLSILFPGPDDPVGVAPLETVLVQLPVLAGVGLALRWHVLQDRIGFVLELLDLA